MKKKGNTIVVILAMMVVSFSFAHAGEREVLKALEKIKGSTEAGVSYTKYCDLLADAKVEINILKRSKNKNERFLDDAEDCYREYSAAKENWEKMMESKNRYEQAMRENSKALAQSCLELEESCKQLMFVRWKQATFELDRAYKHLKE